jgi:hypothetical protein
MDSPILITGISRSGTSLTAGAIHICGAFKGTTSHISEHNAKGMFENNTIKETILKPYLEYCGVDKMCQYPLPDIDNLPVFPKLKERIQEVMFDEGYKNGFWMYKDTEMTLLWKCFHNAFPDAKWVIVRRDTEDIINSCFRTGFMTAFSKKENQLAVGANDEYEGWLWWVNQHLQRFKEMHESGLNIFEITPQKFVGGNYTELYALIEWLGLKWNSEVLSFIDPRLFHARNKK